MIEKRTMWMVDYDHKLVEVTALYDTKSEEVEAYKRNDIDEYCSPYGDKQFFDTRHDAELWILDRQDYLIEMMPRVKEFLEEMHYLEATEDFDFEQDDFLPSYYRYDNYYMKQSQHKSEVIDILRVAARQQMICIGGNTFPISKVRNVKWCSDKAEITVDTGFGLGQSVLTTSDVEYEAIEAIFGTNVSSSVFK